MSSSSFRESRFLPFQAWNNENCISKSFEVFKKRSVQQPRALFMCMEKSEAHWKKLCFRRNPCVCVDRASDEYLKLTNNIFPPCFPHCFLSFSVRLALWNFVILLRSLVLQLRWQQPEEIGAADCLSWRTQLLIFTQKQWMEAHVHQPFLLRIFLKDRTKSVSKHH